MLRREYEPDYERWSYHPLPRLLEFPVLSPIRESDEFRLPPPPPPAPPEDTEPLPELIIERERPRKRRWEDESEEFYDQLAKRMRKYCRRIFNIPKKAKVALDEDSDDTGEITDQEFEELKSLDPRFYYSDAEVRIPDDLFNQGNGNEVDNENNGTGQSDTGNLNNITMIAAHQRESNSGRRHSDTFTVAGEHQDAKDGTESESTVKAGEAYVSSVETSSMEGAAETIVVQALVHDPPKKLMITTSQKASGVSSSANQSHQQEQDKVDEKDIDSDSESSTAEEVLEKENYQEESNTINVLKDITSYVLNEAVLITKDSNTDNPHLVSYSSTSTCLEEVTAVEITTQVEIHEKRKGDGSYVFPLKHNYKAGAELQSEIPKTAKQREVSYSSDSTSTGRTAVVEITTEVEIHEKPKSESSYVFPVKPTIAEKHEAEHMDVDDSDDQSTSDAAKSAVAEVAEDKMSEDVSSTTESENKMQGSEESNSSTSQQLQENSDRRSTTTATPENSDSMVEESSGKSHPSCGEDSHNDDDEVVEDETVTETDESEDKISHGANQDGSDEEDEESDGKLSTITEVTEQSEESAKSKESELTIHETGAEELEDGTTRKTMGTVDQDAIGAEVMRKYIPYESFEYLHMEKKSETPEQQSPELSTREHSLQLDTSVSTDVEVNRPLSPQDSIRTSQARVQGFRKRAYSLDFYENVIRKRTRGDFSEKSQAQHRHVATQTDDKRKNVGVMTEKSDQRDKGVQTTKSDINTRDFGVQTTERESENFERSHEYDYSDGAVECYFKFRKN